MIHSIANKSSLIRRREGEGRGVRGNNNNDNNRRRTRRRRSNISSSSSSSNFMLYYYYCLSVLLLLHCIIISLFNNDNNNNNVSSISSIIKVVDAYIVLSRKNSFWNPKSILDVSSRKIISVGIEFEPDHGEITSAGQADTQCITSVGDIRGFASTEHIKPQMCIDVTTFPPQTQTPYGIVAGISGRQATLYEMSFIESYSGQPLLNPMNLPIETYPVGLATDIYGDGGVYVALHDTGGLLVEQTDWESELKHLLKYFDSIFEPKKLVVASSSSSDDDNNIIQLSSSSPPIVMKVNMTSSKVIWQTTFDTQDGRSTIGGIAVVPSRGNILVVAGSSNGYGTAVGANVDSDSDGSSGNGGEWDGYVTLVDSNSGIIDDSAAALTHITADHSLRIQSQVGQDDFVHNVCVLEDKIFLVGSTTGIMDDGEDDDEDGRGRGGGGAFIMKLDLDTLNILWKTQIYGDGVTATRCMGLGPANTLYVAGHVPPNIILRGYDDDYIDRQPTDDQDIMTAAIDTNDGTIQWVRQIDSRRDDRISSLMVSSNGNMFLQGNAYYDDDDTTTQQRGNINKVYLMTLELNGGIHDWLGLPQDADPIEGYAQNPNGGDLGDLGIDSTTSEVTTKNGSNADVDDDDDDDKNKTMIIVIAVVVPVVLLILVAIYAIGCCSRTKKEGGSNNNNVTLEEGGGGGGEQSKRIHTSTTDHSKAMDGGGPSNDDDHNDNDADGGGGEGLMT